MNKLPDKDEIEHIYLDDEDERPESPLEFHGSINSKSEIKKLKRLVICILVLSTFLSVIRGWEPVRWVADFLAVFFITFAALKINDIEGFAHAYRKHDVVSKAFPPWSYIFPFVETFLGFWYLLSEAPIRLNIITMIVSGVALYGIRQELKRKSRGELTSYSTFIRLPLVKVNYYENVVKFMSAILLVLLNYLYR